MLNIEPIKKDFEYCTLISPTQTVTFDYNDVYNIEYVRMPYISYYKLTTYDMTVTTGTLLYEFKTGEDLLEFLYGGICYA